jgi:hypothetical protein
MNHLEVSVAKQGMAESETGVRYLRRDDLVRAKSQEPALSVPFFDQTKGNAWRLCGEELAHELPIDGKPGQQGINLTHGSFPPCLGGIEGIIQRHPARGVKGRPGD